ncbi:hypothetical protein TELCIR_01960, partial [Teladorsagia circumcincta]
MSASVECVEQREEQQEEAVTEAAEEGQKKATGEAAQESQEENVIEVDRNALSLDLTRTRLKKIEGFEFLTQIRTLCLRWNLLKTIEGLHTLTTLTELDL